MRIHADTPTKTKSAVINDRHIHRTPFAVPLSRPSEEILAAAAAIPAPDFSRPDDTRLLVSPIPGAGISGAFAWPSPIRTPKPREVRPLREAASFGSKRDPSPRPNPEVDIARQGFSGSRLGTIQNSSKLSPTPSQPIPLKQHSFTSSQLPGCRTHPHRARMIPSN
jgi:hypothetical protein